MTTELRKPIETKLLRELLARADAPTKSELAQALYGRIDGSTRAMTTRLTAALVEARLVEDRLEGRERRVFLTAEGRREAAAAAEPDRNTWLRGSAPDGDAEEHADDRPRFHLRHAALLSRRSLAASRKPGESPTAASARDHYEQVLLSLRDEGSSPEIDANRFYQLVKSWPGTDHTRILMSECVIRFQEQDDRRTLLNDLVVVGDLSMPDADTVLWATCAGVVAHQNLTAPRVEMDRLVARGLLQRARALLSHCEQIPALATAASYRLAVVDKAKASSWTTPSTPCAHDQLDRKVKAAIAVNEVLEILERALMQSIGPWLSRTLPSFETWFRRTPYPGFAVEIGDWKAAHADVLADMLWGRAIQTPQADAFRTFLDRARELEADPLVPIGTLAPHLYQAAWVLGDAAALTDATRRTASWLTENAGKAPDYRSLVMNNFWTPEMVAADMRTATGVRHAPS